MIIGKYTAYVSSAGGCGKTRDGKWYWREGAYNSSPFNTCAEAQRDWDKKFGHLNITKHPDSTAKGGGISANTYKPKTVKATDWITGPPKQLQSRFTPPNNTSATNVGSAASNTVKLNASGKAGAGVTAGASISATVSDLQSKTNKVVSDVLPDVIEDPIENAGIPLWMLPVGIVGAGLVLILLMRR